MVSVLPVACGSAYLAWCQFCKLHVARHAALHMHTTHICKDVYCTAQHAAHTALRMCKGACAPETEHDVFEQCT
eukprot:353651-Chlamydomonas_euryale.AAC.7